MGSSVRRRERRLLLGATRKSAAIRWMGSWVVRIQFVSVLASSEQNPVKADEGAERSFLLERKSHRGQRRRKPRARLVTSPGGSRRPKVAKTGVSKIKTKLNATSFRRQRRRLRERVWALRRDKDLRERILLPHVERVVKWRERLVHTNDGKRVPPFGKDGKRVPRPVIFARNYNSLKGLFRQLWQMNDLPLPIPPYEYVRLLVAKEEGAKALYRSGRQGVQQVCIFGYSLLRTMPLPPKPSQHQIPTGVVECAHRGFHRWCDECGGCLLRENSSCSASSNHRALRRNNAVRGRRVRPSPNPHR